MKVRNLCCRDKVQKIENVKFSNLRLRAKPRSAKTKEYSDVIVL